MRGSRVRRWVLGLCLAGVSVLILTLLWCGPEEPSPPPAQPLHSQHKSHQERESLIQQQVLASESTDMDLRATVSDCAELGGRVIIPTSSVPTEAGQKILCSVF